MGPFNLSFVEALDARRNDARVRGYAVPWCDDYTNVAPMANNVNNNQERIGFLEIEEVSSDEEGSELDLDTDESSLEKVSELDELIDEGSNDEKSLSSVLVFDDRSDEKESESFMEIHEGSDEDMAVGHVMPDILQIQEGKDSMPEPIPPNLNVVVFDEIPGKHHDMFLIEEDAVRLLERTARPLTVRNRRRRARVHLQKGCSAN
jgi:hypothetical protein